MRKIDFFGEDAVQHLVELARRGEVATERLLDDDPRVFGGACLRELLDDRREHARRDRQVVRRALGLAQLALAAARRSSGRCSRRRRSGGC